jgi:PAS domain-containing protein
MNMSKRSRLDTREQFRLVLDNIADGVVVQDAGAALVYINPAATRLLGFESVEAALTAGTGGLLKDFAALFDDSGRPLAREQLPGRLALNGEKEPAQVVRVQTRGAGVNSWKWAWVKASPIAEDGSEKPEFVVTVFQEITKMKKAEQGLKQANQRILDVLEEVLDKS